MLGALGLAAIALAVLATTSVLGYLEDRAAASATEEHYAAVEQHYEAVEQYQTGVVEHNRSTEEHQVATEAHYRTVEQYQTAVAEHNRSIEQHNLVVERHLDNADRFYLDASLHFASAEAWECVHAWSEVFRIQGFTYDEIRGSVTGDEMLTFLKGLYFTCLVQFPRTSLVP
jgi:hypothetical protein